MGSSLPDTELPKLWIETPCIPSAGLSRAAGCNIFLKLENLQPSGSFKSRGVGNMMRKALLAAHHQDQAASVRFYISSGGNAGLACACAALALARPCTIVVPESVSAAMVARLRAIGDTTVHQFGRHWAEADAHLRDVLLAQDPAGVYVPPFDHPDVWEGASSLVAELAGQMSRRRPDALVCSVGGGGLLCGVMEGVARERGLLPGVEGIGGRWASSGSDGPAVLAVETEGADSLDASIRAGRLVSLERVTSAALSLGAARVAPRAFEWAVTHQQMSNGDGGAGSSRGVVPLRNVVISDAEAVRGSLRFAEEARMLVELACGATIATACNGDLRQTVGAECSDEEWKNMNVVLVVCGGSHVSMKILQEYAERFGVS